jgi:RNA polymerase sigma factor (sigma-70 family)
VVRQHRLNRSEQEDVAQQTWLCLFQHIESVRDPVALGAWLATVARRECLRALALSQREVLVDASVAPDRVDPASPSDAVELSERRSALHAAVAALPAHERLLIETLLAKSELTYDELSRALGIPRGSIGPTRGRGIARLRRDPHLARALRHSRPADGERHPSVQFNQTNHGIEE